MRDCIGTRPQKQQGHPERDGLVASDSTSGAPDPSHLGTGETRIIYRDAASDGRVSSAPEAYPLAISSIGSGL